MSCKKDIHVFDYNVKLHLILNIVFTKIWIFHSRKTQKNWILLVFAVRRGKKRTTNSNHCRAPKLGARERPRVPFFTALPSWIWPRPPGTGRLRLVPPQAVHASSFVLGGSRHQRRRHPQAARIRPPRTTAPASALPAARDAFLNPTAVHLTPSPLPLLIPPRRSFVAFLLTPFFCSAAQGEGDWAITSVLHDATAVVTTRSLSRPLDAAG
jgi:hypothetical protein